MEYDEELTDFLINGLRTACKEVKKVEVPVGYKNDITDENYMSGGIYTASGIKSDSQSKEDFLNELLEKYEDASRFWVMHAYYINVQTDDDIIQLPVLRFDCE